MNGSRARAGTPAACDARHVEASPKELRTVARGLDHPEGVAWSPREGALYAGGEAGQLYRVPLDGSGAVEVARVAGGFLLGLALDADGRVYACDTGNRCVQRIDPDASIARHGGELGYPNYPVFADDGALFVSDSGSWEEPEGVVVRIDPDGTTERVLDGLRFANGLAIAGGWLYVVESAWPGVVRMPLAGGRAEPVVALDRAVPDGLAFDADGGLWISCFQPNHVYRLDPSGELRLVLDDWTGEFLLTPTNLAFAGPELDLLVFASLGGDALRALEPGVRGVPLLYPRLP
jgi:gluconolactonase